MSRAQVIVLAGPSGAGKSRLASRLALPVLPLDDFYRDGDDPGLPRVEHGSSRGIIDWDDPTTWHHDDAVAAIRELCTQGRSEVPVYDISLSARQGVRWIDLAGHDRFVAEGIFAAEVVAQCRAEGLLAAAYCVTQHPLRTFGRRLARDLREHRKPPWVLLRRGVALMLGQRRIVARARELGCDVVTPDQAFASLTRTGQDSR